MTLVCMTLKGFKKMWTEVVTKTDVLIRILTTFKKR
jgi:hypothetical protein